MRLTLTPQISEGTSATVRLEFGPQNRDTASTREIKAIFEAKGVNRIVVHLTGIVGSELEAQINQAQQKVMELGDYEIKRALYFSGTELRENEIHARFITYYPAEKALEEFYEHFEEALKFGPLPDFSESVKA